MFQFQPSHTTQITNRYFTFQLENHTLEMDQVMDYGNHLMEVQPGQKYTEEEREVTVKVD